ncbi:MAG TPA: malic enzyme-like NAD(P)-binding protein, partial [bacterium]|nr:malic enzyme-like NAD(P)-binding protein [bacterium]
EVVATKQVETQRDLSLAYTPGVARVVEEIAREPSAAFDYTARGNLVAVVTNGTAILGLGDRGPLAAKPVMEGKGVLFKRFADIDVFDIELDAKTVEQMVSAVAAIAPTFGGINLEDIKAPECFEVERQLKEMLDIPVFHDDQHGTAIITGAALLNALEITGRSIGDIKVVVLGAGAAALACAEFYVSMGVRREHVRLVDTKGVVYAGRTENMNPYKSRFAAQTDERTLVDAVRGAHVFLGLSGRDLLSADMLRTMADQPIVFACANPDPEIRYETAREARPDAIVGTGRSDYPNQINNLLGFPFIFRGALDVHASTINEQMKLAAARALAALAHEGVPECQLKAFGASGPIQFGPEYLIPKPLDPRILFWEAPAVARAAMDSGVARRPVDLHAYVKALRVRRPHCVRQCGYKD